MADREVTIVLKARDEATAKLNAAAGNVGRMGGAGGMFGGGGGVRGTFGAVGRMSGLADMGIAQQMGRVGGISSMFGLGGGLAAGATLALKAAWDFAADAAKENAQMLLTVNAELARFAKALSTATPVVTTHLGKAAASELEEATKARRAAEITAARRKADIGTGMIDWFWRKLGRGATAGTRERADTEAAKAEAAEYSLRKITKREQAKAQIELEKKDKDFHLQFMQDADRDRIAEERKGEEKRLSMVAEVTAARLGIMRDGNKKEIAILTAGMNEEIRKAEGTGVDKELIKQKYALKMAGVFGAQDAPNAEAMRRLAPTFESRSLLNAPGATATRLADDTARIRALQDRGTRALEKILARLDKGLSVEMAVEGLN